MIRYYIKIAWRSLIKRKFYSVLNISGLAIAIACSLFLYLYISFHLSFDTYHVKSSTTYRVVNELLLEETLYEKGGSMAMYKALKRGLSRVTDAALMLDSYSFTVTVNNGSKTEKRFKEDRNVALVSPEWFKMFSYSWIAGNPAQLNAPNTVSITRKQAIKYFGNVNPIGKTIVFDNRQPVKVVGLIDDKPGNTDLKAGMYVSLSSLKNLYPDISNDFFTDWGWINSTTSIYLSITDKKSKREVESAIADLAKVHMGGNSKYYKFRLQPLADVHFDSQYGGATQKPLLITLTIIGILILIIASVNYINLSIAQQAKRSIEIGMRKVLGGTSKQLFIQFMTETLLTNCLAMLIAVGLVVLVLPSANQFLFAQEPLLLISYNGISIFLGILFILLITLSGFYPAFVLSKINVFKDLKNETQSLKAGFLRKILVVIQNSVAQTLIICTLIMVLQVRFLKHTDMGFNRNAVVLIPLPDSAELKKDFLRKKLEAMPHVQTFSFCFKSPSSENDRGGSVHFDNRPDWETWPARSAIGDTSYVKSFGLQIIAGRNIRESKTTHEYLINEKMVYKLGLKDPDDVIGKPLIAGELDEQKGIIVGVVKDFNTKSLIKPVEPVLIASFPDLFSTLAVKLKGQDLQEAISGIRKSWEEIYPQEVFDYQFLDDQIANLYRKEDLQQKVILLAASVAIIISCLGLLGLVSLVTLQRTKEIGIRKVLGASVTSIITLLSKDFIKLIFIAITIASPLSWFFMNKWLQNFAYRIEVQWWVFALAAILAVMIALITISFQAIKAALANPVKSLRME
ncbi:MAG: ABC transporter permease [Flavobacterium sp.]|nr:ABC transporter permease [Pedobacter sp.]